MIRLIWNNSILDKFSGDFIRRKNCIDRILSNKNLKRFNKLYLKTQFTNFCNIIFIIANSFSKILISWIGDGVLIVFGDKNDFVKRGMHGMEFEFGGFLEGLFGLGKFLEFDLRNNGNFLVHVDFEDKSCIADCVNAVVGCSDLLDCGFDRKLYVSWGFVKIALTKKPHDINLVALCQEHTWCKSTLHLFDSLIFDSNFCKLRYKGLIQYFTFTIKGSCVIHFVHASQ